ncbi:hypothetical protein C6N75_08480 [Streptomyces solincola]|uniref:Uncharacterized protein n=1 Tax=Streptomyces solincola TaxID=2100817 RepID=A0A2S9PZ13_9ACTN|nr:hypothetical protein C6N75_08480 [Streptomyces solincola]
MADIAASAAATARYLADLQLTVRDMERHLAVLTDQTTVHVRGTHLQGDRFYHARLRARPVEKALEKALRDARSLIADLERAAYQRRDFDTGCDTTVKDRKQKELEKTRKKSPHAIPPRPNIPPQVPQQPNTGYAAPVAGIHDLRGRESA